MGLPWEHPFTCLVAGSSGSGKTFFVQKMIESKKDMIHPTPERIVWAYSIWQPIFDTMPGVEFVEGLPEADIFDPRTNNLLVIDDLQGEENKSVCKWFTKVSHHKNVSVFYLVQNLFDKSKEHRTISLNSHYMVLFKNPRDASQITHLAQQMYPTNVRFMQESYRDATATKAHSYLLVDAKQNTDPEYRLRTTIFPGEIEHVYLPRKRA